MDKEAYRALLDSCAEDEYVIPAYHDPEAVKAINKAGLFGDERKEAFLNCHIEARKVKRSKKKKKPEKVKKPIKIADEIVEDDK